MAQQTLNNDALMNSLFEVFRCRGYEGTSISQLSEETGLQKSSLYHHFPAGKDDMLKTVVIYISNYLHKHVFDPLLNTNVTPAKRFSNMIVTITAIYGEGRKNCLLNVLNLGDTKSEIREMLNYDYNDWLIALNKLGREVGMSQQEAEIWSERFLIVVEGALVIQRLTNNQITFEKHMDYEENLFLKQCSM